MPFRPARLSDVPRIHALRRTAADGLIQRFGWGPWGGVSFFNTLKRALRQRDGAQAATLFVLEESGRIAATCTLDPETPGFYRRLGYAQPEDPALYLRSMSVDPALQGRGVGRRMMAEAEDLARRLGLKALRLDAYAHAAGAGGFYAACGYALVTSGVQDGVAFRFYEKRL
jgi:GNAT superfamily N-acetyltransferase